MRKTLHLLMTALLLVIFGISSAQTTQFYGYALGSFGGETWSNKFISFDPQTPSSVQTVSETFPEIYAATYVDGYVWFVTSTRSLCKVSFDEETQTFGTYETIVSTLVPYNLVIEMAYNPMDGMMYFLCQDSQYNMNLKRISMAAPSEVEDLGNLSEKLWTLAIDSHGTAYGIGYPGDLYQVDLDNCALDIIGSTGKDIWYTQSMAFDNDSGELFWAQLSSNADHGLYRVDTQTGEATSLGEIGGSGAQLAGLFMVSENVTPIPEPEIISEIYIEGFTEPVWGEHPDYELEVNPEAPYTIAHISWHRYVSYDDHVLEPEEYFDLEDVNYYLFVLLSPKEGFIFDEHPMVCFNNDNSVFNYGAFTDNDYRVYTIDYQVTNPVGIAEQTMDDLEGQPVNVYDMTGRLVFQGCYNGYRCFEGLKPGVYVINTAGHSLKVMIE